MRSRTSRISRREDASLFCETHRIFIVDEQKAVQFLAEQLAQGLSTREARSSLSERTVTKETSLYVANRTTRVGHTPYSAPSYSGAGSFEDTLRRLLPMAGDAPVRPIAYSPDFTLVTSSQPHSNAQGTPSFVPAALPPQAINPTPPFPANPFNPMIFNSLRPRRQAFLLDENGWPRKVAEHPEGLTAQQIFQMLPKGRYKNPSSVSSSILQYPYDLFERRPGVNGRNNHAWLYSLRDTPLPSSVSGSTHVGVP
jgi:hypothetical protein